MPRQDLERRRAVIVGFNGGDGGRLEFAHSDARRIGKVLERRLQFKTKILVGRQATPDLIRRHIIRASNADVLLMYFSGHADYLEEDNEHRLHLCPSIPPPRNIARVSIVALHELETLVREFTRARVCVLVVDACRVETTGGSGGAAELETGDWFRASDPPVPEEMPCGGNWSERPTLITLLSCGPNEVAFEHRSIRNSLFTDALCEELEAGPERALNVIFQRASKKTVRRGKKLYGQPQRPEWFGPMDIDIWLARRRPRAYNGPRCTIE